MKDMINPCNPDHNGECLICDCWLFNCAYQRLLKGDFRYEKLDELLKMFEKYLTEEQIKKLRDTK